MTRSHVIVVLVAALFTVLGWWTLWFLCDDAYIAFRYVRMAHEGHGFTWNPPPFRPVEGYTSFAWVAMLYGVWEVVGVEPTRSANVLSLAAGLGSLGLVARMALRLPNTACRTGWFALVLLAVTTNRTWLTWTTSGLETALWTFVLLAWVDAATNREGDNRVWMALAAGLPLIRPDGLLYLAVTPALVALRLLESRDLRWRDALLGLPYAVPIAHLLWRFSTYGVWLPNTYYAKVVEPWPLMGVLQTLLFAYDHAFWLIGLVVLGSLWRARPARGGPLAIGIVALHLFVLLRAGGDHFASRIFVHWVPLAWLGFAWAWSWLGASARRGLIVGGAIWAGGAVIPWSHHALTSGSGRTFWTETEQVIAPSFPALIRPPALLHDKVSRWLAYHLVGTPHHLHVAFLEVQRGRAPNTVDVERIGDPSLAVWASQNPGYAAYHLPEVAVIDLLGLNDFVIARTPAPPIRKRKLAHERQPPPGYVECFVPNVTVGRDQVVFTPRQVPFDADTIRACEALWWAKVR